MLKLPGAPISPRPNKPAISLGWAPQAIAQCGQGQFYYRAGNKPAFKLRVRSDRLKLKGCVDRHTWEEIKAQQIERYYRPIDDLSTTPLSEIVEGEAPPQSPPASSRFDFDD